MIMDSESGVMEWIAKYCSCIHSILRS